MSDQQPLNEVPGIPEIRAALDRVLASPPFSTSPQLLAFLRFVVESALKGDAEHIKSYTIAVEALGRGHSFDPQADPIVRVEAGRVRRALQHYYAGPGKGDPVIIDLPLGGYIPTFRRRADHRSTPVFMAIWHKRLGAKGLFWLIAAQFAGLFALAVFMAIDWSFTDASDTTETIRLSSGRSSTAALPYRSGMPVVVVQRPNVIAARGEKAIMLDALCQKLRDALARFDEIEVVSEPVLPVSSRFGVSSKELVPGEPAPRELVPRELGPREPRSLYRLSVTAKHDSGGVMDLSFRLHDSLEGTIVWVQAFENLSVPLSSAAVKEIIQKVTTVLAQPYGVIYARERAKLATNEVDPRYRCIVEAFEYWRGFDRSKSAGVRACLEEVTVLDPTFAEGFAILGLLLLREYYEPESGPSDTLDPAFAAAQRAVELKPQSARAHHALMGALFARGNTAAALLEGEKMISLNPCDMLAVQAYGMRLILSGHPEKGKALLHQVAVSSPVRTPRFEFSLFLAEYLLGRHENAAFHPRLFTNNDYPLLLVARAVTAVQAGAQDHAKQAIDRLIRLHPGWRDDPRGRLERYIPASAIVDRLAQDLTTAGLIIPAH